VAVDEKTQANSSDRIT